MELFLDYYHPYAGLCNQLYLITNHLHSAFLNGCKVYIHKFNIDIFNKTRIPVNGILDLVKTQENLNKMGIDVLLLKKPKIVKDIPKLCIWPVSSIEILSALEFNNLYVGISNGIKRNMGPFNGIHFRLDTDAVLRYTFGETEYNTFMDLANKDINLASKYFLSLDREKIENWCADVLEQYTDLVSKFGFDRPWYICTSVAKDPLNVFTKGYLDYLLTFITDHGGSYYIHPKEFKERELNALVDLLVLRDSVNLVAFEGSSFSEGYCLKVNTFRKNIKNYLCVKVNEV